MFGFLLEPCVTDVHIGDADMRYVSPPASDAAEQANNPVKYPRDLYPEIEP